MGDLLVQAQQQLLPQDLTHHLPLRLVGGLALREQPGALLAVLAQLAHQLLQPRAGVGGDGQDGIEAVPDLVIGGDHRQQLRRLHSVDLVDAQDAGELFFPDAVDQGLLRGAYMGDGFHQQKGAVHVGEAGGDHLHHILSQGVTGLVEARSVQQDELGVPPLHHAVNTVVGGLGLVGDDSDLLPHQGVGQAGLAHIGPSADGDHGDIFDFRHR